MIWSPCCWMTIRSRKEIFASKGRQRTHEGEVKAVVRQVGDISLRELEHSAVDRALYDWRGDSASKIQRYCCWWLQCSTS